MGFSNIMDSNSYSPDQPLDSATESLIAARDRTLGPSYRLFYERPVHLVRGLGTRLYDADGDCYLDAYNNVACVGHCHPTLSRRPAGSWPPSTPTPAICTRA